MEIKAVYERQRLRFENPDGDVIVAEASQGDDLLASITVKGPDCDFIAGRSYRFFGHWAEYENRRTCETEKQFHFRTAIETAPAERHGVITYLQRAPHVGQAVAKRLWDSFGPQAVETLRERPGECTHRGFTEEKAEEASSYLVASQRNEDAVIDLLNLLDGQGLPKSTVRKCLDEWGNRAAKLIRKNPYVLMRFRGIGFKRCDRMYLAFGLDPDRLKRQALCAWYGVAEAHKGGNTWVYREAAIQSIRQNIAAAKLREKYALRLALRSGMLQMRFTDGMDGELDWDGDFPWLADSRKSNNEARLARLVSQATAEDGSIALDRLEMSDHQADVLLSLIRRPGNVKLFGGGPGTGKTFCAAQIARQLVDLYGRKKVALAAPTGKAAVRLTEAMQEYGVLLAAKTWHSLLGVQSSSAGDGWGFRHGPDEPLPYKVVIGDETSMLDTDMASKIFAARGSGTLFLLIGDVNQLPPVGHGAPLRDMIAAGVPNAELTELHRTSGEIARQCKLIREENRIEIGDSLDLAAGVNIAIRECSRSDEQIRAMLSLVAECLDNDVDPVWGCLILCPTNNSGDLGRKNLNKILQSRLNSNKPVGGSPFRLADKVVCLQNSWLPIVRDHEGGMTPDEIESCTTNDNGQVYVANGDIGRVIKCEPKLMHIELQSPRRVVRVGRAAARQDDRPRDDDAEAKPDEDPGTGCSFDLAYALSCHKSQGSEAMAVIVMLDPSGGARRICDRSWLYTAISRAKKYCWLVGEERVAQQMLRRNAVGERKTFLRELLE